MRAFLQEQAKRYGERLEAVLGRSASGPPGVTRDLSDEAWRAILDEVAEAEALGDAVAPYLRQALQQAFAAAMAELGLDIGAGDDVIRNAEATLKADLITRVSGTTKEVVSEIVRAGLATGATIQDMQESIASSRGFAQSRALTISRTEATRAVSRGAVDSYRRAVEDIPELQMQWLSARDDSVRPAHAALDGDVSEVDGTFVDEHGHRAAYPGGFGVAADDINCRCTVIPYFAEEAS